MKNLFTIGLSVAALTAGCGGVGLTPGFTGSSRDTGVVTIAGSDAGIRADAGDADAGDADAGDAGDSGETPFDGGGIDTGPLSSLDDFVENSIAGPQTVDISSYRLVVKGLVDNPLSLTYDDVISKFAYHDKVARPRPRSSTTASPCVEGWTVNILWGGVALKDLFDAAKVQPSATVVILRAYDSYSTSFPLSFIDHTDVILAYRMNGQTIPVSRGFPFMLAADGKWGYKWIKWITEIELSDDVNFRGYWEQRGYSNDGSRDKPSSP